MPDSSVTNPLAPSGSTTEGKLAVAVTVLGGLVMVLGGLGPSLTKAAETYPNLWTLQLAALVSGAAMTAVASVGLSFTRARLKVAALQFLSEMNTEAPALLKMLQEHFAPKPAPATAVSVTVSTPTLAETPAAKAGQP